MSRLAILCCAFLFACNLRADMIIFNDTQQMPDGDQSGNAIGAWVDFGGFYAQFSPGTYSGVLSAVGLLLVGDINSPTSTGSITVDFCTDSANSPQNCSPLGTANYGTAGNPSLSSGAFTLLPVDFSNPATNPTVSAGNQYWIELTTSDLTVAWATTPDYADGFEVSCPPGTGVGCENYQLGSLASSPNTDGGPFQMEVEIAPSIPEPDSFLLVTSVIAALRLLRRRRATS
jgi:hypothetical protein